MKYLVCTLIFFSFLFSYSQEVSNPDDLPGKGIQENSNQKMVEFEIKVLNEPVLQRSFLLHRGIKKTHTISVGSSAKTHYSYDLSQGSLLQVWSGRFLDATKMWKSRGEQQLGVPIEKVISLHGNPDFYLLQNDKETWPKTMTSEVKYKQLGYELDKKGNPIFMMELNGSLIKSSCVPLKRKRGLKRTISIQSKEIIWHKIAEGDLIKKSRNGSYRIETESNYFVKISKSKKYNTIVRKSAGKDELLVEIPNGKHKIRYTILW